MMNAVKSIIRNCTSIKRKIDALPTFDIEFLFLRIRAKSAGEEADVIITAPDDGETEIKVKVPLEEVTCEKPEGHNPKIMLDDDTGVVMTYLVLTPLLRRTSLVQQLSLILLIRYSQSQQVVSHKSSKEKRCGKQKTVVRKS